MKRNLLFLLFIGFVLTSCNEYTRVIKFGDTNYKYEAAKTYYAMGQYERASSILTDLVTILKGTDKAEESMYMLGMSYYNDEDYETANTTFTQYVAVYPHGQFMELARFYSGKAMYLDSPEARLDQSGTYKALAQLQAFMEYCPNSTRRDEAQTMVFALQDKLVEKEYRNAKLYYNLGNYLGNNYLSCIVTAQNALKDFPYTSLREDLSMLILRAKSAQAFYSIDERKRERYRETVDEYYSFKNEFPESKYIKEAEDIFNKAQSTLDSKNLPGQDEE